MNLKKILATCLALMALCLFQACGGVNGGAAESAQDSISKEAVDSAKNSKAPAESEKESSLASGTEAAQKSFVWEPDLFTNCGTDSGSLGYIAGDEQTLYYFGDYADGEWKVISYDLNTKQKKDTKIKAWDPLYLYEGALYCVGDKFERHDLADGKKSMFDLPGHAIWEWRIVGGDIYYIDRHKEEIGDIFVKKADGSVKKIDSDVFIYFLDTNDTEIFYAKSNKSGYTVYVYDIETEKATELAEVENIPSQVFGNLIILRTINVFGVYYLYDISTQETEILSMKLNKDERIISPLGNGNALFFIVEDTNIHTLTLYARDMDTKTDYKLGMVPDTDLATAEGRLYSLTDPGTGNLSLLNFVDGKVEPEIIEMSYPYPYVS